MGINIDDFRNVDPTSTLRNTKVLIFNRHPQSGLEPFLYYKKRFGFKIVCDVDDYWELYPRHILYKAWMKDGMNKKIMAAIRVADVVTVTTPLLADKVKPLNKNVLVIPNSLPFGHDQFNSNREQGNGRVRILYAGGSTHYWDLKTIEYALQKIRNNKSLEYELILAGYNKSETWDKIESAFNLRGTILNYTRRYTLGLEEYMDHYNVADVSIAPLESNSFNGYKSNLKVIEAGCKNIPCITSNVSPYSDEEDTSKIIMAKNTREWYDALSYCIKNPSFVYDKGHKLGEYVREKYDMFKINELRRQLFEHLSK